MEREGPLVVVVVAGQDEVDGVAAQDGLEHVAGARGRAVPPRRVRRVVEGDDLPLGPRVGQGVVEPRPLLGGAVAEHAGHARVQVEEVDRSVRRPVIERGGPEQAELGLDLGQAGVAVTQVLVVVPDGELEPDTRVHEGAHGPGEDVVEAVLEVAVVADVAEQRDEPEGLLAVGLGHPLGHHHRLAAPAAVVAESREPEAIGRGAPRLRFEDGLRRGARDEVLLVEHRPDVPGHQVA